MCGVGWWWCGPACLVCVWWCWGQGGELWWSFFSPLLPAPRSLSPPPPAHCLGGANTAPVTAAVISCTVCTHWCSCFTSPLASIKPLLSRLTSSYVFCWAPSSLVHQPFPTRQHFHIVHLKSCWIFFSAPLFMLIFHALSLCPPCQTLVAYNSILACSLSFSFTSLLASRGSTSFAVIFCLNLLAKHLFYFLTIVYHPAPSLQSVPHTVRTLISFYTWSCFTLSFSSVHRNTQSCFKSVLLSSLPFQNVLFYKFCPFSHSGPSQ